jgi:hypothetical protein
MDRVGGEGKDGMEEEEEVSERSTEAARMEPWGWWWCRMMVLRRPSRRGSSRLRDGCEEASPCTAGASVPCSGAQRKGFWRERLAMAKKSGS